MIGRSDRGSGSLLALAIAGCLVSVLALALSLYIGLAARAAAGDAADAAALGAADVASGISPGSPCAVAATIAVANGTAESACEVDGLVVTVRVDREFLGIQLVPSATAGPPGVGTN